jgi:transcriptional regulator with XRE-family HTH domain
MSANEHSLSQANERERRQLGLRVRELRRMRDLTTRNLSELSGLSASMISQIETGRSGASVGSLTRLATSLGVPLAEFFVDGQAIEAGRPSRDGEPGLAKVVRRNLRKRLQLPESHLVYELLTPDLRWPFEFLWVELEPNHPPIESRSHPGQECALVIAGSMHVVIADEEYVLGPGDSISFDSGVPHHIENRGRETVIQISAISPPNF